MRFGKALKSRFELIRETPIRILAIVIAVIVSLCYGLVTVIAFSEMPDSVRDFPVAHHMQTEHEAGRSHNRADKQEIAKGAAA